MPPLGVFLQRSTAFYIPLNDGVEDGRRDEGSIAGPITTPSGKWHADVSHLALHL